MNSKTNAVPRLDLAPKLNRPLNPWNLRDHLRILLWTSYFPQAASWYINTFGSELQARPNNWWQDKNFLGLRDRLASFMLGSLRDIHDVSDATPTTEQVAEQIKRLNRLIIIKKHAVYPIFVSLGILSWLLGPWKKRDDNEAGKHEEHKNNKDNETSFVGEILSLGALWVIQELLVNLRLDSWLLGLRWRDWGRTTWIPWSGLREQLLATLRLDWETGLHNLNQVLTYSRQIIPAGQAFGEALQSLPPDSLLLRLVEAADILYDWNAFYVAFTDGTQHPKDEELSSGEEVLTPMHLATPAPAAIAGFWYLHEKQPEQAAEAFAVVRSLPHGEAFYRLSSTLALAFSAKTFDELANLGEKDAFLQAALPPQQVDSLLHASTWQALAHLRRAAQEALAVQRSVSRAMRSQALNRALGEVVAIRELKNDLPEAERKLVLETAAAWEDALLSVAGEVGRVPAIEPVRNPYVVGDPVVGEKFVGREDVMHRLEELWLGADALPSVVLYGHRRMGKTSVLRNLNAHLGAGLHLAYVNLSLVEVSNGTADLLSAVADEVQRALQQHGVSLSPPESSAFDAHPYRAFERFLHQVRAALGEDALLIALDEFEQLETWMAAGNLPRDLLNVLRGYLQMEERIAFVFAGLHTLQEMTSDYFQPFFASVVPVPVTFLKREAVFQLLANPGDPDFLLDYAPEALERIWNLTGGQPYLVQWVGHRLVSRFNDLTFEQGKPQEPVFRLEDVEAVIEQPEFFAHARYYFAGVWKQAAQGTPHQQEILRLLAREVDGLPLEALIARSRLDPAEVRSALDELARHDVVREEDGHWHYTIELMRRWMLRKHD